MVNFYKNMILKGRISLSDVPERWNEDVKAAVIAYYVGKISSGDIVIDDVPNTPDTWQDWVRAEIENA